MDPLLVMPLATAAGQALVTAMMSDGWAIARQRFAELLGGGDHRRTADLDGSLDLTQRALASGGLDPGATAAHWQRRFEELLEARPDAARGLRTLANEYRLSAPHGIATTGNVSISATSGATAIGVQNNGSAVAGNPSAPGTVRP